MIQVPIFFFTLDQEDVNKYIFDVPLQKNSYVSITLAWDREVSLDDNRTDDDLYEDGETFTVDGMTNMDLYLLPKGETDLAKNTCASISSVDSVEHIFCKIPADGEYEFWVRQFDALLGDQPYAVAWWAQKRCGFDTDGDGKKDDLILDDTDGDGICEFPRRLQVKEGTLRITADTPVEAVRQTSIKINRGSFIIDSDGTVKSDGQIPSFRVEAAQDVSILGALEIDAANSVTLLAKEGSLALSNAPSIAAEKGITLHALKGNLSIVDAFLEAGGTMSLKVDQGVMLLSASSLVAGKNINFIGNKGGGVCLSKAMILEADIGNGTIDFRRVQGRVIDDGDAILDGKVKPKGKVMLETRFPCSLLTSLNGSADRVGESPPEQPNQPGRATIEMSGEFTLNFTGADHDAPIGELALFRNPITVKSLLNESDGAGELVANAAGEEILPVTLLPPLRVRGSQIQYINVPERPIDPQLKLILTRVDGDVFHFDLEVEQVAIPSHPCPEGDTVRLITDLEITSSSPSFTVPIIKAARIWRCGETELDNPVDDPVLPPLPEPEPGNKAPKASLRTELLTRNTGQPDLVELDGIKSSDKDGTIVSYKFQVVEKQTGDVVFDPPAGPDATVVTPEPGLFPGNYRASLVVTDDQGAVSKTATRGFSVK